MGREIDKQIIHPISDLLRIKNMSELESINKGEKTSQLINSEK